MNCLVCGHKLAIFRKLSLGDFCCLEHRTLFLREHNEQGVMRLAESANSSSEDRPGATRVYAQFLQEELAACHSGADYRGYGPLSASVVISPEAPFRTFSRLAPAQPQALTNPQPGKTAPIGFGVAGGAAWVLVGHGWSRVNWA